MCGYLGSSGAGKAPAKDRLCCLRVHSSTQPLKFSQQFQHLESQGWKVVHHETVSSVQQATSTVLGAVLERRRAEGDYEVDGIIIASDSHAYPREQKIPITCEGVQNDAG